VILLLRYLVRLRRPSRRFSGPEVLDVVPVIALVRLLELVLLIRLERAVPPSFSQ
jgi:hypothetical protein